MNVNPNRERDLVLTPNEFAYISDQTKGHVVTYVGPFKTSMANTDRPVIFDPKTKRFKNCNLDESTQVFTAAPEGWYVELKNPSIDGKQPNIGTSNNSPALQIGRKVNLPGPIFFALWPGQMVRVTQGHYLRSNQYLVVRIYDEGEARKNWAQAVVKPQTTHTEDAEKTPITKPAPDLTMGQHMIIKGTEVSFYIPPTGVEVVRDQNGNYVRDAVTLERLEYCILLDESGNKRYIQGPDVVFPEPTEMFIAKNGQRKYRAIELNENSGIYLKVIAPYTENGKNYSVGDELFVTGKEQMIYFPRPEHALIKYGDHEIYYAVAIPPGEGRYFLNKTTGKITLQTGPCMFLPDPRENIIVNRVLTEKQTTLWFPNNQEALIFNRKLKEQAEKEQTQDYYVPSPAPQAQKKKQTFTEEQQQTSLPAGVVGDEISRTTQFTPPRSITLNSKYSGAVMIDIWTGYAVMVVSKTGERKVIVGPKTYLLEYDEILQTIELSTGTPKTDDNLIRTVYLRSLHNKVSDVVKAETKDFCEVDITLSYRINFTGEPEKWFNVENYVKFLTDHLRSVIRNAVKKYSVLDFYADSIALVRDIILGKASEDGKRQGRSFKENGMAIYDVEVLDINLQNIDIQDLISTAKHSEVKHQIALETQNRNLEFTQKTEEIQRQMEEAKSQTTQAIFDLRVQEIQKQLTYRLTEIEGQLKTESEKLKGTLEAQKFEIEINSAKLEQQKATQELQMVFAQKLLEQRLQEMKAEVDAVVKKAQAVSPDLVAALQAFGDKALAERMAESMAPLSILGGKSIAEVFSNLLKGTVLEHALKPRQLGE